jgi:hypothetical protein
VLGVCGHVAEGSVVFAAAISVMVATYMTDPAKPTGLDAVVKSFGPARFRRDLVCPATVFAACEIRPGSDGCRSSELA